MQNGLVVGVAVRDITPADPQHLQGYSARYQKSAGVREPLSVRCLAVGDGRSTVLIVCLDLIGVRHPTCQRWYGLLEQATGIGFPSLVVCGTHTHFAPGVDATIYTNPEAGLVEPDPVYLAHVETGLVEAAREAIARLRPARLETVRIPVPGVLFNRRTRKPDGMVAINYLYPLTDTPYEFPPVDDQLTVLRFRDAQGAVAALANFGCHPVTGTDVVPEGMRHISADYPYYLRAGLEAAWHCPVLFALGSAGDTVPINRQGDCRDRIGRVLADTAVLAERRFRPDPVVGVSASSRTVEARTILSFAAAEAPVAFQAARDACLADPSAANRARYDACSSALLRSRLYPENRLAVPIQCLRLGSQALVTMPFEVLSEISLRMKERYPNSLLISCAGGYEGYLPLAHEFPRGGYGASPETVHFAEDTGDRLLAEAIRVLSS